MAQVKNVASPKICISIGVSDYAECCGIAQRSAMFELRLDLMQLEPAQLERLLRYPALTVATCREGKYGDAERLQLLQFAVRSGASYVDVELEADETYRRTLVELAKKHGCKIIISYHNFEQTPTLPEMRQIIAECRSKGADVVKLVTAARSAHDSARILSLYEGEKSLVAFAMGDAGKITRVAGLYLGAPFTYASPALGLEAAPGQIAAERMSAILRLLNDSDGKPYSDELGATP
ncbi:MAG: type I 3-dehydroquinate dehydratase [Prevotellaceae bacterium]|jgi:3-dehydroquinate dehydratase type I|nr:type I 3-dehydroquinate dehydratase [Prevotellaceae bacterium]